MGLRISTNTQALAAQRNLVNNNGRQKHSLEKLASGTRIVRAADDAAGLAISEKMRADIRSIRQNVRNAEDGINMIATAEGAMQEIGNILTRFRELSIQAASDTVGMTERKFIEKEVQSLKSEIDRISRATEFNGNKLLVSGDDGFETKGKFEIQIGLNNRPSEDRFVFDADKVATTLRALELDEVSVLEKEMAQNNLGYIDNAITKLSENRSEMGALQNRLQASINNMRIYDESLSASRSSIYDVDFAIETSELTKNNILAQTNTSVLGQANSNATLALKLI